MIIVGAGPAGKLLAYILAQRGVAERMRILPEVTCAQRLDDIIYNSQIVNYKLLNVRGSKIAENHVRIITGSKTYRELHKEVFSLSGLRTLLSG